MALPTPVNGMITDAITQANVKVLGDAPAMAMGAIYQSLAHCSLFAAATGHRRPGRDQSGGHPDLQRRHHGRRCRRQQDQPVGHA